MVLWGDNMRSEKEMFDLILKVAKEDGRVRAVYMSGSRTNPNIKKDIYQDYDIGYVVTETKPFLDNKSWISVFGDIAIVQEPDLVDIAFGVEHDFSRSYTWLMLFKDGNRIDLGIETKGKMLEEYTKEKLIIPLLDKDNCLPKIPPSTDEDYWVKKPTELQYASCCNEFWWCLNNVAKGIARDELSYAMWMFNVPVRDMLVKMIEWYIGVKTNFSLSAGKLGKFFKNYLPKELYDMYCKTYSDSNYNNFWEAVFKACELFRTTAAVISEHFGYNYNKSEDMNMTEYLTTVQKASSFLDSASENCSYLKDSFDKKFKMDVIETIYKRRSIRNYLDKKVERDTIMTLLKAATAAPTAANCQPWEFVVIDDDEKLSELRDKFIFARYNAPAAIVVCGNMKLAFKGQGQEMWVQDCSAAIENILIAATSLELGSVWIGVYPIESNIKPVKKILNIPEHVTPLGIIYVGYPAEEKKARARLDEKRIYWQEYEPSRKHRTKDKPVIGHY